MKKVKRHAKDRGTSISAMFAESVDRLDASEERTKAILQRQPRLPQLFDSPLKMVEPFDERSIAILRKHG